MKVKLTISYDGTKFNGSQVQPDFETVQSKLHDVLKLINIDTTLEFSGRTDKGVHATGQAVSCTIPKFWNDLNRLKETLNTMLPNSIYVKSICSVEDDFHARFHARQREYRYLISPNILTPFNSNYLGYYKNINKYKIQDAIKILEGIHDFEFFSKKGSDPKSTIREIYKIRFYKYKGIYVLQFTANSYLRSQIRMMVDFIMKISSEKLTLNQLQKQLNKEELVSWTLASPSGLYLSKIRYNKDKIDN